MNTASQSQNEAPRDSLGVTIASLALGISTLGACCSSGGTAILALVADRGDHMAAVRSFGPFVLLWVAGVVLSVAGLVVARRRSAERGWAARGLPFVALMLAVGASVTPCILLDSAQREETARHEEALRVHDISAIGRPCQNLPSSSHGTCPERYACTTGALGETPSSVPRCEIICDGNHAFCGAGSHCGGAHCVRD